MVYLAAYLTGSLIKHMVWDSENIVLCTLCTDLHFACDLGIHPSPEAVLTWKKGFIGKETFSSHLLILSTFLLFYFVQYSFQKVNASALSHFQGIFFLFRWRFIYYFYGKLGSVVLITAVTLCSCSWQHRFTRDHLPCLPSSPQLEETALIVKAIQLQLRGHPRICKLFSPLVGAALVTVNRGCLCPFNYLNSIYPPIGLAGFFPSFM